MQAQSLMKMIYFNYFQEVTTKQKLKHQYMLKHIPSNL